MQDDEASALIVIRRALAQAEAKGAEKVIGASLECADTQDAEIARLKAEVERLEGMLTEEYKACRIKAEQELSQELADEVFQLTAARDAAEAKGVRMGLERARMILAGRVFADGEKCCNCDVEIRDRLEAEIAKAGGKSPA